MATRAIVWYGPKVLESIQKKMAANMDRAAIYVVNDVVQSFGSPSAMPEGLLKRTYGGEWRKMRQKEWRNMQHSAPGDPPFVQTGTLRRSITFDAPDTLVRRVGSTMHGSGGAHSYPFLLEYGSSKMLPRPFLRPALDRCKTAILKLIAGK